MKLGFLELQLQGGFPLRRLFARQLAATSNTGEEDTKLPFAESLKRGASIERSAGTEIGEQLLACANPLNLNVTYSGCSGHLSQMLSRVEPERHWSLVQF
jgi:hypothetical protein